MLGACPEFKPLRVSGDLDLLAKANPLAPLSFGTLFLGFLGPEQLELGALIVPFLAPIIFQPSRVSMTHSAISSLEQPLR